MTVIADVTIQSDDFVLGQTMQAVPDSRIEVEQLVPSGELALPYFWVEQPDADAAEAALREESAVATVRQVDSLDDRVLFRIEWTEEVDSFLENFVEFEAAVLEAAGTSDEWQFQLRFQSYERLSTFYRTCIDDGVGVELDRVHSPVEAASESRFGLTDDQEETLMAAFEASYFAIPRGTTISELGETLEISDSAVSQRLRRGESSLIEATLLTAADTSLSGHRDDCDRSLSQFKRYSPSAGYETYYCHLRFRSQVGIVVCFVRAFGVGVATVAAFDTARIIHRCVQGPTVGAVIAELLGVFLVRVGNKEGLFRPRIVFFSVDIHLLAVVGCRSYGIVDRLCVWEISVGDRFSLKFDRRFIDCG